MILGTSNKIVTQHGQTLIETLVACFILVMGIAAALGLATYSLQATGNIRQQTIAMGLAREGLEVVKNMRDTNWLRATITADCHNFSDKSSTAFCYKDWLKPKTGDGYDISPDGGKATFSLRIDRSQPLPWILVKTDRDFGLDYKLTKISGTEIYALYYGADGLTATAGNSGFARKITITEETFTPFDQDTGPRLKVTSQVWWNGKNCTMADDPAPDEPCSVTLETYLTNWRVF